MRIGILGGTFNPVHNGHLHIAREALKKLKLERLIFVPAYLPPHKKIEGGVTAADRLCMLQLAVGRAGRFSISPYEIRKRSTSYSIETVRYFRRIYGRQSELFFVIGADCIEGLASWKNVDTVASLVQLVVVPRPGYKEEPVRGNITRLSIRTKDISSTEIRLRVRKGRPISDSVPRNVSGYIKAKGLYLWE